ncbi:MAG: hypothetical protein B1H03_04950 [Planctomycetales bacterium 4484_113]|nr:MAG: hypothetical protein B1H03_04950 [Planctomycetales bacterium 4484_113]
MDSKMTWQEAQTRLLAWAQPAHADAVRLPHALYTYTDQPLPAEHPYPPFNIALTQGYAVNHEYVTRQLRQPSGSVQLRIMGRVPVGKARKGAPIADRAFRARAGDLMPEWLDTIVDEPPSRQSEGSDRLLLESIPEKFTGVMPAGSIIPQQEKIINAPRRLGYPELAILAAQGKDEVHAFVKPMTGLLVIGTTLRPPDAPKASRERMPDIMTPMFQYIFNRWQFPFLSLGIHEGNLTEHLTAASEQVDILLVTGIIPYKQWTQTADSLEPAFTVRIRSLHHPLGHLFLAAEAKGRWVFFLPYHPVFGLALYALLLLPFLFRMSGDPEGYVPFRQGRLMEGAVAEVPDDDIWIGEEKMTRDFAKTPELKLLKQVSRASMATLAQGNCLAIPRSTSADPQPGDFVAILRY